MTEFIPFASFQLKRKDVVPQCVTPVPGRPDAFIADQAIQRKDKTETLEMSLLIRNDLDGKWNTVSQMWGRGHGMPLEVEDFSAIIKWPTSYNSDGSAKTAEYVKLPWTADKTWLKDTALANKIAYRKQSGPAIREWLQGRVTFEGTTYRLYGSAEVNGGKRKDVKKRELTHIEIIRGGKIITAEKIVATYLGRLPNGEPIGGQLEAEGLSLLNKNDGSVHLLVGVTTGLKGNYIHRLWTYQLKAGTKMVSAEAVKTVKKLSKGKVLWAIQNSDKVGVNATYVQRMLKLTGYYLGPLDGLAGPQTQDALARYAKFRNVKGNKEILTKLSYDSNLNMEVV